MAKTKSLKYLDGGRPVFRTALQAPSNPFFVGDVSHIAVTIVGTGILAIYGSAQKDAPDFTQPSAVGNLYRGITTRDYSLSGAGAYNNGDTGTVVVVATKILELDTSLLTWIGFAKLISFSNAYEVIAVAADNQ